MTDRELQRQSHEVLARLELVQRELIEIRMWAWALVHDKGEPDD